MSLLALSPQASVLKEKLEKFVTERCIPGEKEYEEHINQFNGSDRWIPAAIPPVIERLKKEAQELGLWNLFLPHQVPNHLLTGRDDNVISPSIYLSNREYGILCEVSLCTYLLYIGTCIHLMPIMNIL